MQRQLANLLEQSDGCDSRGLHLEKRSAHSGLSSFSAKHGHGQLGKIHPARPPPPFPDPPQWIGEKKKNKRRPSARFNATGTSYHAQLVFQRPFCALRKKRGQTSLCMPCSRRNPKYPRVPKNKTGRKMRNEEQGGGAHNGRIHLLELAAEKGGTTAADAAAESQATAKPSYECGRRTSKRPISSLIFTRKPKATR